MKVRVRVRVRLRVRVRRCHAHLHRGAASVPRRVLIERHAAVARGGGRHLEAPGPLGLRLGALEEKIRQQHLLRVRVRVGLGVRLGVRLGVGLG